MKGKLQPKRILIASGVAAVLFCLAIFLLRRIYEAQNAAEVTRILSDGFLLPAAVLGGVGALSWVASKGFFDMITYGCGYLFGRFLPTDNVFRNRTPYYDYHMAKEKKGREWLRASLLVGAVCLVLCVAFAVCNAVIG